MSKAQLFIVVAAAVALAIASAAFTQAPAPQSGAAIAGTAGTDRPYRIMLCFSPWMELNPSRDTLPYERIVGAVDKTAPYVTDYRTYGLSHGNELMPAYMKSKGRKVWAGAWVGNYPESVNKAELDKLVELCNKAYVDVAIVGSEVLYRNDLTSDKLIEYIRYVKDRVTVPVTFDDTGDEVLAHPEVVAECEGMVLANLYPFWAGISIENSICNLSSSYRALRDAYPDKEIVIGETGWQSEGQGVGSAVASPANAARYFNEAVSWARANRVRCFVFQAFDETWKPDNDRWWGIWTKDMLLKPGFGPIFKSFTTTENKCPLPPRRGKVYGRVIDQYWRPIEGAQVYESSYQAINYYTNANGEYEFELPVKSSEYTIVAHYLRHYEYFGSARVYINPTTPKERNIVIRLRQSRIEGRVLDSAGKPLQHAYVALTPGTRRTGTKYRADGSFFFTDVPMGDYVLTVSKDGYGTTSANVRVEPELDSRDHTFYLWKEETATWPGTIAYLEPYEDGNYTIWRITNDEKTQMVVLAYPANQIRWSPDGHWLAFRAADLGGGGNHYTCMIERNPGTLHRFEYLDGSFNWYRDGDDTSGLMIGIYFSGLYLLRTDGAVQGLMGSRSRTYDHCPEQAPDGDIYFAHHEYGSYCYIYRAKSAVVNGEVQLSDYRVLVMVRTYHDENVSSQPLANGTFLLNYAGRLELRRSDNGGLIRSWDGVYGARVSPDGKLVACTVNGQLCIYKVETGSLRARYQQFGTPWAYSWSPDSQWLAIAARYTYGEEDGIFLWRRLDAAVLRAAGAAPAGPGQVSMDWGP